MAALEKKILKDSNRIVIKVGSALIRSDDKNLINEIILNRIVKEIINLNEAGKEILLVSSGALALGKKSLNFKKNNLKNLNYSEVDFDNEQQILKFIDNLKLIYEDFWKSQNQINTSVKLSLNISIDNSNNIKINKFEKILSDMDLIYNFSIYKFDNRNNFYKVIFNGTPDKFLEVMGYQNYNFEIKNKIWVLNDKS